MRFPRIHRTMAGRMCSINAGLLVFLFTHMCFSSLVTAAANNTLESNQQIKDKDGDTLVSANNLFQLGFFSPGDPQLRYVGIWLNNTKVGWSNLTVWVANREKAIVGNTGILSMRADGNLVVSYENGTVVWSTNIVSAPSSNGSIAVLEDSGNLVVRGGGSGAAVLWESFDHPGDTLLPGMKIGVNLTSRRTRMLTAWRNMSDPSPGIYKFGIDPQDPNQFFVWRGSVPYERAIFWNGSSFNILDDGPVNLITVARSDDEVYLTISPSPPGTLRSWLRIMGWGPLLTYLNDSIWLLSTKLSCSGGRGCGPNSGCNKNRDPICKCLPGYEPTWPAVWNSGNWKDGCIPSPHLQCESTNGYLTLQQAKLPLGYDLVYAENKTECEGHCDNQKCGCRAYAWKVNPEDPLFGSCYVWNEGLREIEESADYDDGSGLLIPEVNIRVAPSILSEEGRRCGFCGINAIPYPLSTSPICGDPNYSRFNCNSSTGLLYFRAPDGSSYLVSSINEESRTFVIKPQGIDLCWAGSAKRMDIRLNSSWPFHLSRNNTVLLLNCSSTPENVLHLNCSSSSPCHRYIQEGRAPCFHSQTCCSYATGGSESNKSHDIGVLDNQCASYASIVNLNSSALINSWHEGIQIEWDAPQEPVCDSNNSCSYWPNTSCRARNAIVERKRCLCNDNFLWNLSSMNCTPGGRIDNKSLLLTRTSSNKRLIPIVTVAAATGIILVVTFAYCSWRKKKWRKVKQNKLPNMSTQLLDLANGNDNIDVPFIDFKYVIEATENFSDSNKLGRGGFGLVYKGKLPEGQEIAVKRLSKWSGQGLEEFKTEILLIAKLQHRNLVRMLGYCIEEDEKMLIYEYMPNKSLDFFLFDPNRRALLDWEKRFSIILGIARGLLYLHQDSRLRIIHRDLKTSNILLDEDMNPKISDFGMARIFGGNQTQENTNRVVGTYGYMSPEYAANGFYSVKSDVYSLGIIILEIVSGKKNADFFKDRDATSLTTYAWQLWKEERGMELMDPSLRETCNETQVLKCVHLGLLCVQDNATDRHCMSSVLYMLDNATASLPLPNQPAFFRGCFSAQPRIGSSDGMPIYSNNEATISTLEAR